MLYTFVFRNEGIALPSSVFGQGNGRIWLGDINCDPAAVRKVTTICNTSMRCENPTNNMTDSSSNMNDTSSNMTDVFNDMTDCHDLNNSICTSNTTTYINYHCEETVSCYNVTKDPNLTSIAYCKHSGWGRTDCSHNMDAGVWCTSRTSKYKYKVILFVIVNWALLQYKIK